MAIAQGVPRYERLEDVLWELRDGGSIPLPTGLGVDDAMSLRLVCHTSSGEGLRLTADGADHIDRIEQNRAWIRRLIRADDGPASTSQPELGRARSRKLRRLDLRREH